MISVLTVTNRPRWMPWLWLQADSQSYTEFEHIVVCAGPVDQYQHGCSTRTRFIESPKASIPFQRNLALAAAQGDIVCWFDDDDCQHPDRLHILAMNINGTVCYVGNRISYMLDLHEPTACRALGYEPFVFNGAGFLNKNLPRFNEALTVDEDIDWLRRLAPHDYQIVQRPILSAWISHNANITGRRDGLVFDQKTRGRVFLSDEERAMLRSLRGA